MLKIAYASDIHLELNAGPSIADLEVIAPDVVVLAGDIGMNVSDIVGYAQAIVNSVGCHVILVAGNHEYYDSVPVQHKNEQFSTATSENPSIHFLQNGSVEIEGVLFLGGTLWTDLRVVGDWYLDTARYNARRYMNDFRRIYVERLNGKIKKLTTDYWEGFNRVTHRYIKETLQYNKDRNDLPTVVVTHHGGHHQLNGDHPHKQQLRPCYVSDMTDIYGAPSAPTAWISGHTHEVMAFESGGTLFASNCYGYEGYEPHLTDNFEWQTMNVYTDEEAKNRCVEYHKNEEYTGTHPDLVTIGWEKFRVEKVT